LDAKSSLELGRGQLRLVLDVDLLEARIADRDPLNLMKVVEQVGGDVKETAVDERAVNRIKEIFGNEAAAVMTPFRPRVGKEEVKFFDRVGWQQIAHGVGDFDIQNAHIVERGRFSACLRDAAGEFVDAEKILLRNSLRELAQERAIATAKIDMQRRGTAKDRDQVELRDVRFRNQLSHATSMRPLRGDSTAQRLKIST
jgi:hypothetical protein